MKKVLGPTKKRIRNPVCAIYWRDAAYSYEKELPAEFPMPQATFGLIIVADDEYTNIATNVGYNLKTNEIYPVDGLVIPKKAEIKFKKIGYLKR
ncbi:MAG: hypothetical protein WCO21_02395 [bacterium]|nr:hypothetical protein [Candidatus Jorgensenbacteria bacterium]